MNNHLTDRQLLDAQFKLCSDAEAKSLAAHLDECADCRGRANALKQKISSLELMRADVSASEQLIAETLRQVRNPPEAARSHILRFVWLAGAAAAAAVVLAVIYTGPVATQPISVAKVEQPAAPVMQVAMQLKEPTEAAPAPAAPAEAEVAAEAKPVAAKAMFASRARGVAADAPAAPAARAIVTDGVSGATYPAPKWVSDAPADVTVQIYPTTLADSDDIVLGLKNESRKRAQQWSMNVISRAEQPVTTRITRAFGTTNWSVSVPNQTVQVITQSGDRVVLSVPVKPRATTTFTCTTILPVKGDEP